MTSQMKATEQYFPVVLFIMLYNAVLTFKFEDEILKCDPSNDSYLGVQKSVEVSPYQFGRKVVFKSVSW